MNHTINIDATNYDPFISKKEIFEAKRLVINNYGLVNPSESYSLHDFSAIRVGARKVNNKIEYAVISEHSHLDDPFTEYNTPYMGCAAIHIPSDGGGESRAFIPKTDFKLKNTFHTIDKSGDISMGYETREMLDIKIQMLKKLGTYEGAFILYKEIVPEEGIKYTIEAINT